MYMCICLFFVFFISTDTPKNHTKTLQTRLINTYTSQQQQKIKQYQNNTNMYKTKYFNSKNQTEKIKVMPSILDDAGKVIIMAGECLP